ncbi:MAG: glycosyltransferase family 2 protein [Deltaproteobacteria bacterium]|jgi:glycosyltransferase involved in cell wall biosynthesis|nr:glycosyltransferase family 2 protein [Deltaproteobacteria bacterium]
MPEFQKRVSILMGTRDGGEFLSEQLKSIEGQDYPHWSLTVSDDGSTDETIAILNEFREGRPDKLVKMIKGPGRGFSRNFLNLALQDETGAAYFAWADQDDVWLPFKLSHVLKLIAPYGEDLPVLYCGRTKLIDENGAPAGFSPLRSAPPPLFSNAIVQSIAGGNTMVFNREARRLIVKGCRFDLPSHDWWAYQVISGAGGLVVYDSTVTVEYRQHGLNLVGSNRGLPAFLGRVKKAWLKNFRSMNDRNFRALSGVKDDLSRGGREILDSVVNLRSEFDLLNIRRQIKKHRIFRRSAAQQAALYLGFRLRRV